MHGSIELDSEVGVGSIFSFTVAFDLAVTDEATPRTLSEIEDLNVLVVDDNHEAREILEVILGTLVAHVSTARSGEEALALLAERSSGVAQDVVLLDWMMPGLDGIQTARCINDLFDHERPPLLLMTSAHDRDRVLDQASGAGIDGFIAKPVTRSSLVDALTGLLSGAQDSDSTGGADRPWWCDGRFSGKRILLVEDNSINQQVASEMLHDAGLHVVLAGDGQESLDRLAEEPFDLVLMDLQMPVMGGYEATTRIREQSKFDTLPIVAMTAHVMPEDRARCLALGMNDHVGKPVDPNQLYSVLERLLDVPDAGRPAHQAPAEQPESPIGARGSVSSESKLAVDLEAGVQRVAGNRQLYEKLMREFCEDFADMISLVRSTLEAGELGNAIGQLHSLKGVAGNLCMLPLHEAAGQAEYAARDGKPGELEIALVVLEELLGDVLQSIVEMQTPGRVEGWRGGP
jgi:two-component system sensor histidine kinase/response regulator